MGALPTFLEKLVIMKKGLLKHILSPHYSMTLKPNPNLTSTPNMHEHI